MENDEERERRQCANCHRTIDLGADAWTVEENVIGPRGVVPLGLTNLFCSEGCVAEHFDDRELEKHPRRIP